RQHVLMSYECCQLATARGIPQPRRLVGRSGYHFEPVRAEFGGLYIAGVPLENSELATTGSVPDTGGPVVRSGQHSGAVGAELRSAQMIGMAAKYRDRLLHCGIPDPGGAVLGSGNKLAIGTETGIQNRIVMTPQAADLAPARHVPDAT